MMRMIGALCEEASRGWKKEIGELWKAPSKYVQLILRLWG